ncbi:hypothetical protein NDA13_006438 [Ustilago tritici]|nr:hypothetical protein NDA13_006438 [Ustilago tritici]
MLEAVPRVTHAGSNTNVVVAPAATASRTAPDPVQVATPRRPTGLDGLVSLTPLSPTASDLEPAQRPPPPQGLAWHIDSPAGLPNLSTPLLQGLAQLVGNSASTLDLGTPPLQGSARSVIMPAGLGGTRTPLLQGLAQLFDSVPAALDVPSADWCLSLLLNVWSHDPGPRPNTSFAGNVFNPALQPTRHSSMQERAFAWSTLLSLYPDPIYCCQLLGMTEHGCLLGYDRPLRNADRHSDNLPISLAGHSHLHREIDACLAEGRLSVIPAGTSLVESPIGVVPKPHSTKLRTIHHLSHPRQLMAAALPSVNAGISLGFIRIRYEGLQDLLAFVSQNPGCLLWKGDLEDAFRHVVTAKRNTHLSFSYNSIRYCENVLTFGGSSSPWLFNLVAEFLHWLVAACLPANWPINHYLDNTFGAIPVSHATHALLPIHILALGLRLSPKKTFGTSTKLKVLGWCDILERWSGTSALSPLPLMAAHIWTNACPKGYGGYLGLDTSPTAVFAKTVPSAVPSHARHAILPPGTRGGPAGPPPGMAASLGISACAANLLWHGLAASTHRRAGGTPSSFQSFCLQHFGFGTSCFPATSLQLLEWLAHLSSLGHPFHLAKHGLGALQSHHVDLGLDTSGFSCGRLEHTLCSYKHLQGVGHSGTKLPITLLLLCQVLLAVGKMANLFPRDCLVLQAAFALTFACFLRSGKLVWVCGTDHTTILTVSSVKWASDHVVLTLPASKTNPFQQGVHVVTLEVGGIECPVARLQHLSHGLPPSAPLFGLGPSSLDPLPWSTFITILCHAIQACGLPVLQYASHSFCHGVATWASQHGASTTDIQSLGRWSSDCYHCYINRLAQERCALVTLALFSVHDVPLVPSGPAWRDPGLA